MPVITINGPKIDDLDKKRELAKELTQAAHKAYGLPESKIVVYIKENIPDNVAVGGELIVDRDKG